MKCRVSSASSKLSAATLRRFEGTSTANAHAPKSTATPSPSVPAAGGVAPDWYWLMFGEASGRACTVSGGSGAPEEGGGVAVPSPPGG